MNHFNPTLHTEPYAAVYHHATSDGYIVWRLGTGGNCELLHLRSYVGAPVGTGRALLREMLRQLRADPPYHTVFGFTRASNTLAHGFYEACGFRLTTVPGVYADGLATLFSAPYAELCRRHLE